MQLWQAALLLAGCVIGAVKLAFVYLKEKKRQYLIFAVLLSLLGTVFLIYALLTLLLVGSR